MSAIDGITSVPVGSLIADALEFIVSEQRSIDGTPIGGPSQLWELTKTHLELSLSALIIATLIAVPIGLALGHYRKGELVAIAASNVGRAVPSLALIALFVAFLGAGFLNVALALTLLAIPPILTGTYVGVAAVDPEWHACHRASGKTDRYRIDNGACADPFAAKVAWRPPFRLDLAALQAAAAGIAGRRDWRGFTRRGEHRADLERAIDTVAWHAEGAQLVATVGGDGFTYHLVRSLVGAMVAVATGTCRAVDLARSLAGEDTPAGKQQAPARGLCLEEVRYVPEPEWTAG